MNGTKRVSRRVPGPSAGARKCGENFTRASFVEVCAEFLGDAEELADFEACYYRGTGSRNRSLGVDGFAMDDLDGSARLVIAEYGGEAEPTTLRRPLRRRASHGCSRSVMTHSVVVCIGTLKRARLDIRSRSPYMNAGRPSRAFVST